MSEAAQTRPRGPNCWQCRFFAVSWDPRMPYACQRLGFKTAVLPAIEVLRVDGQPCRGFLARGSAPAAATSPAGSPPPTAVHATRTHSTRQWQA